MEQVGLLVGEDGGRGKLGEPQAADGGADGRNAQFSDHQVSPRFFFSPLPEGRTKGYFPTAMTERKQMDGICEKSLWQ